MSVISGRIPAELEAGIRVHMASYANNITSVLSKFPSQAIALEVDKWVPSQCISRFCIRYTAILAKPDRELFFMTAAQLMQLVQRYRGGTRGHMRIVVDELLRCYLRTEQHFLAHQYDKCVMMMKDEVKDNAQVTQMIFSHQHVAKKNQLVIMLIDHVNTHEPMLINELKDILTELTQLGKQEHSRVALQARQVSTTDANLANWYFCRCSSHPNSLHTTVVTIMSNLSSCRPWIVSAIRRIRRNWRS